VVEVERVARCPKPIRDDEDCNKQCVARAKTRETRKNLIGNPAVKYRVTGLGKCKSITKGGPAEIA